MLKRRVLFMLVLATLVTGCFLFIDLKPAALCCPPGPPPMPLRTLYNDSDRIVVARVGESKVTEVGENNDLLVRTALHVSSTVKGKDDQPVVFREHWEGAEDPLGSSEYSAGDTVLVFLARSEEGGYEVLPEPYAVKKLSDPDLKIYLQRISELAKIIENGKPDPADLVEWLVRCVEEPATRWEGAYELNLSASMLFNDPDDSGEDAEVSDEREQSEEHDQTQMNSADQVQDPAVDEEQNLVSSFAALLTESQKKRLVDALIGVEKIEEGDLDLITLASHWQDPRLVPFLLSQLRREQDIPPYYTQQMMETLAGVFGDKKLKMLAARFGEISNDRSDPEDEQAARPASAEVTFSAVVKQQKVVLKEFLARVEKKVRQ